MAKQDTGVYEWREGILRTLHAVEIDYEKAEKLIESTAYSPSSIEHAVLKVYYRADRPEWYFCWTLPIQSSGTIRCTNHADVLCSVKFFAEMGFKLDRYSPPRPEPPGQ